MSGIFWRVDRDSSNLTATSERKFVTRLCGLTEALVAGLAVQRAHVVEHLADQHLLAGEGVAAVALGDDDLVVVGLRRGAGDAGRQPGAEPRRDEHRRR